MPKSRRIERHIPAGANAARPAITDYRRPGRIRKEKVSLSLGFPAIGEGLRRHPIDDSLPDDGHRAQLEIVCQLRMLAKDRGVLLASSGQPDRAADSQIPKIEVIDPGSAGEIEGFVENSSGGRGGEPARW